MIERKALIFHLKNNNIEYKISPIIPKRLYMQIIEALNNYLLLHISLYIIILLMWNICYDQNLIRKTVFQ